MTVFTLHSRVLSDYEDFVRSFFIVAGERAREFIERTLLQEQAALARVSSPGQPLLPARGLPRKPSATEMFY
jgi:hypothetical protein